MYLSDESTFLAGMSAVAFFSDQRSMSATEEVPAWRLSSEYRVSVLPSGWIILMLELSQFMQCVIVCFLEARSLVSEGVFPFTSATYAIFQLSLRLEPPSTGNYFSKIILICL